MPRPKTAKPRVALDLAAGKQAHVYRHVLGGGRRRGWAYVAMDVTPLENAKPGPRAPLGFVHGDARGKLPFPDEFAHVVYLNAPTFEADEDKPSAEHPHFRPASERFPDAHAFLRELHRILKPGGRAVLAIDEDVTQTLPFLKPGEKLADIAKRHFARVEFVRFDETPRGHQAVRDRPFLRRLTHYGDFLHYLLVLKKAKK